MVVVVDLEARQVIWVDLCKKKAFNLANNVETAKASALTLVKAIVETENTLNFYRLFTWWANANDQIVESKEADLVFSTDDEKSCVNKHNLARIIADYIPE